MGKLDGLFLAASRDVQANEGQTIGNFIAIIHFPSKEVAAELYESPEYAPKKTSLRNSPSSPRVCPH
ncbi:MAG: DUF1330 domain-containing protein [Arenimonas sp.]